MKTILYDFSKGVDAVSDRRLLPKGYAVVMDNVDLRSGSARPFKLPGYYQSAATTTTRIWEFRQKWYLSNLYRSYAAELSGTQERIYFAEEGSGAVAPQKIVNDVQAPLGQTVPQAAPSVTAAQNTVPGSLTLTVNLGLGSLLKNVEYSYRVSARTSLGILPPCQGVSITLSANGEVTLNWSAVTGATGYVVFGRTVGSEQVLATLGVTTSYVDDGSHTPNGAFASTFDVVNPYQYVYTYVRSVGTMEDESGPSAISLTVNTGQGRTLTRQVVYDGFLTGATTVSTGLTTVASPYSQQITGIKGDGIHTFLTLSGAPVGPWFNGDGLRIVDTGLNKDYSVLGQNMTLVFPTAIVTPGVPVAGTPTGTTGLGAGTYIWKVAAIRGSSTVTTGSPAITAASSASSSTTLASSKNVPLSWTSVLNADYYRLYRSSDGGSTWNQVVTVAASVNSYIDAGTNEATGVTPPSVNTTSTNLIELTQFDITSTIPTPLASTLKAILAKTIVQIATPQVIAYGDAIYQSGASQSALNGLLGALLIQVNAVATSNVNVSNPGTATFDTYQMANGQILLLTGQSTASQNGPWIFNGSGVALTRPNFYQTGEVITSANYGSVAVLSGQTYANTLWDITTGGSITVDTTSTAWATTTTTSAYQVPVYTAANDTLTSIQWTTGNNHIISWRIYRTGDTSDFLLVAEVPITQQSYTDVIPVTALGSSLPTSYTQNGLTVVYKPPPSTLQHLELFNGMLFGVDGNTVRWTPIGVPDAWPDAFTQTMSYPPLAVASYASGVIILCQDAIYRMDGYDPTQLGLQKTYAEDGLIAPRSVQKSAHGLLYLAKRGIMLFDGNVATCLTEGKLPYKFLTQPSAYTEPYSAQNFWWYTTDHTLSYAALNWASDSPIYAANTMAATLTNDIPQDGPIYAVRSFYHRNKYFLFYSSSDPSTSYTAGTTVTVDLGVAGYPITTLGLKAMDAHVSSLDEAYLLLANADSGIQTTIDSFIGAQAQFNASFAPNADTNRSIWRWERSDSRVPMFIRSGEWSADAPHLRKWWKQVQIYGEGTGQIRVYNDGAFISSLTLTATEQPTKPRRINLPVGTKGYGLSWELQGDFNLRALSIGYEPLPNIQENV